MTRPLGSPNKKVKLHLDLAPEIEARIDQLRDQTYADSSGEVIRKALLVYDFILAEQALGNAVVTRKQDGTGKTLVIL